MNNTKSRIVIAGGSGFLGQSLIQFFGDKYEVKNLSRNPKNPEDVKWDGENLDDWTNAIDGAWAVINMAGRTVDCRYTEENKRQILDSRILSTRVLGEAIKKAKMKPEIWINSSTATIYEDTRGDKPANTEKNGIIGDNFSMNIAKAWEKEFFSHEIQNLKQIAIRTSIVMGNEGGAFPVLKKLGKRGLCSPQGNGNQFVSWIHIADFCRAIQFLLNQGNEKIYNMTSTGVVTNREFNRILKQNLRPILTIPQPKWLLEFGAIFIGTETELILKSRKVYPERLVSEGFKFEFEKAEKMIQDLT